ncbi:MAG TPA: DUF2785 domain-containing protein [Xanthomonadaceae bacterium]|nr:DUF2785 domain-containing protein [Xanthomonadaceae bacterium]
MKSAWHLLAAGLLFVATAAPALAACPARDMPAMRRLLREAAPAPAGAAERGTLVDVLVACLDDGDPALRDALAYETLARWMRAGLLPPAELAALRARLYARMEAEDPDGVGIPFAVLALSEVARTDRIAPWMDAAGRAEMLARATAYLEGVRDYRGFVEGEGWRHGIAHGADWLLQLALNPAIDRAGLERIVRAVDRQLVADHAYVFGEPARLARPLLAAARRGVRDEAQWTAWCARLRERVGARWWEDGKGLARRHDLNAFLLEAEHEIARDPALQPLAPGVAATLQALR